MQRVGWVLMALIGLAAFPGVFGNGPFSRHPVEAAGGLQVTHERGLPYATWGSILVGIPRSATGREIVALKLSRDYLDAFEPSSVVPEPDSAVAAPDHVTFEFAPAQRGRGFEVRIHLRPMSRGGLKGTFSVAPGPPVTIEQLVYP